MAYWARVLIGDPQTVKARKAVYPELDDRESALGAALPE